MGDLLSCLDISNVLSQHICSRLPPGDIQALGQTCHALRQLVLEQLPDSSWTAIAASALPPAHPLLSLPGSAVRSCLERIARAKLVLPEPTSIGLREGDDEIMLSDSAVNHKGTQIIMCKGQAITVCDLSLDNSPFSLTPLCTFQPEAIDEDDKIIANITVGFTWARDDSFAAIHFDIYNPNDPRTRLACSGKVTFLNVLYLYKAGSSTLHRVTHTDKCAHMCAPQFSPSGQQLVVTWSMFAHKEHVLLEIYSTTDSALLTSLHAPLQAVSACGTQCTIAFQPNGQHFAAPRPDGFVVFDSESYEMHVCTSPGGTADRVVRVAFSPDSSQLIRTCENDSGSMVELYEMTNRTCTFCICQDPYSVAYSSLSSGGSFIRVGFKSFVVMIKEHLEVLSMHSKPFGRELQSMDDVMALAVSPDDVLLASVHEGPQFQYALHIHQMATGNLLHTYPAQGPESDSRKWCRPYKPIEFTLTWASLGLRLFVGCRMLSKLAGDEALETLLVFSFT